MVKCPECKSTEIETLDMLEILDKVDEDNELMYYIAAYSAICLNCSYEFTYDGDYTERKSHE